jgi:hypothetical protein
MSFQEFKFRGYCSGKAEEANFKYCLIDDEFGIVEGITNGPRYATPIGFGAGAIIDIYRERGFNLEGNVALFLLQFSKKIKVYSVSYLIENCRSYFPQWKYIDENRLKKYILFS